MTISLARTAPLHSAATFGALAYSTFLLLPLWLPQTSYADEKSNTPQTRNRVTKPELTLKDSSVTLYAAGDIADCRKTPPEQSMAARTADLVDAALTQDKNANALTLGDNTYPIGKPEEFRECYDKTWGKFKTRTLPSPGNHDYGVPMAAGYYNYFDELAGTERRGYYQKKLGNWLILSLNSNIKAQAMQAQLQWLKNTLKEYQGKCVLAFWHHPVVSSGAHGNQSVMQDAWTILADAKADLILSSHDHHYERFTALNAQGLPDPKNGIPSFVVGTGGANLTPLFLIKNGSAFRQNEQHGVLKLQLHTSTYQWEFVSSTHKVLDRGQANCH
ncbi:metallophosphoesterase family protein [Undibacterium flavidum]|uniref:Metallophosphoesterase n=1 Tax=Undibacterium flavidum TaxID=2762297 RepID=A0ABR6YBE3_9BURK|nr:metallophosphoesterase [Undibacterium flavidum]MBC3873916.1 metallophosphoesterase [Undibacterium flavidum]